MQCASCGFENPEGVKFCEECGTKLVRVCPNCGQQVRPTAKFCGECGTTLEAEGKPAPAKSRKRTRPPSTGKAKRPAVSPTAAQSRLAAPEAERRQLTVMFCDLVGSTTLSAQLDPEELREVVRAYQQVSAAVIDRYEGHIAQHLGDGLLVYFGYPVAHEDDAQRAVRTALGLLAALQHLSFPTLQLPRPLQIRISIHTGVVVVGEIGSGGTREQLALGDTPNVAARLQGLAAPDTVVISAATYHLIDGLFDCRDLGLHAVKGVATPLQIYQVVGESGVRSRLEAAATRGLTPLVGREEEISLLRKRWEQAKSGEGQVVLLSGEAGIGKSRLVQLLKEQVTHEPSVRVEYRCSPYHQNSAFYPVIDHLHRLLQFAAHDTPQAKLSKLQQTLTQYRFPQADTLPLLAALLSLPHPEGAPPLTLIPQHQKQKTLEALVAWLVTEAGRQPVLVVVEDVHWVDPSTLEFLSPLLEQVPTTRLLLLLTFRPDFSPPWAMFSHLTQLTLSRLARRQIEVMVEKVTGGKPLPAEVIQQLIAKTDGVPLFVEELTKMVVESGLLRETDGHYELTGLLAPLTIPSTLHDSLMARLDRLATVKEVAQLGATLGREFSYELLQAVSQGTESSLQQALSKLVEAEVLYQRGQPPQAQYVFKHALIQDAAYQSLLRSTRQRYHQQIAQVLDERFPETIETQPELLAYHYSEAGLIERAIPYWQHAGHRAVERSANGEAIGHFTKGLELLKTLPDTAERAHKELLLQTALGPALMITKGLTAPEVERTYTRARALCQQVGETPQLFPVLWGLGAFYRNRGQLQIAYELGERCLTLAQSSQDPILLFDAHRALGATLFLKGEHSPALAHLEQTLALYSSQQHRPQGFFSELHAGVFSLFFTAFTQWFLGYADQALEKSHQALSLPQMVSDPPSRAVALVFAAYLAQFRGEKQTTQERTEAAVTIGRDQGLPLFLAVGVILQGWALVAQACLPDRQGQGQEWIAQIRKGLATVQAMGTVGLLTYFLALLAEAYGMLGQAEEGLTVLADTLAVVDKTGERFYEAEIYRLKGQLMLQQLLGASSPLSVPTPQAEAEQCFHKAIEIARKQQAKSLELRAVMSLARLWQQQGKKEGARQMLTEIYGWFTEGFDTKDLQEAKALLESLR